MHNYEVRGTMQWAERNAIIDALINCDQCRSAAAERLRIGRSTLYRLMERYEIQSAVLKCEAAFSSAQRLTKVMGSAMEVRMREAMPCAVPAVVDPLSKVVYQDGVWLLLGAESAGL